MSLVNLHITADPNPPVPKQAPCDRRGKVYHTPWRLTQLAIPRLVTRKYVPVDNRVVLRSKYYKLDAETVYTCDHISRPPIRTLRENKEHFKPYRPAGFVRRMDKFIELTWNSIYNYYKFQRRRIILRKRKRMMSKVKPPTKKDLKMKEQKHLNYMANLAVPKKVFPPAPIYKMKFRKKIPLPQMYDDIKILAMPKKRYMDPPNELGKTSPAAMRYVITEHQLRLTHLPERFNYPVCHLPPLVPGVVSRAALKAKLSPIVEKLAQPVLKTQKKDADEKEDPFSISPSALKYKATERILSLAKPIDRD